MPRIPKLPSTSDISSSILCHSVPRNVMNPTTCGQEATGLLLLLPFSYLQGKLRHKPGRLTQRFRRSWCWRRDECSKPCSHIWGCGRSLCQAQAGALLSPGGTQLLHGLISTRHLIWRSPVSPRGQEYALYKVFINVNRKGTFPHNQKSLLICLCHLSSS